MVVDATPPYINPLKHGGGGAVRPSLPFFLPFTQNYYEAPIPENSCPGKPFCCGCPYEEKKIKKIILPPSQSTLKYGSENRPWVRGSRNILKYITTLLLLHESILTSSTITPEVERKFKQSELLISNT